MILNYFGTYLYIYFQLRQNIVGGKDENTTRKVDLGVEKFMWRRRLRQAGYLTDPRAPVPHKSLDGKLYLDRGLVDCLANAKGNLEIYLEGVERTNAPGVQINQKL